MTFYAHQSWKSEKTEEVVSRQNETKHKPITSTLIALRAGEKNLFFYKPPFFRASGFCFSF
jgi:hypothetical protein